MGNILFHRRKVVAEELEELQKRGETIEAQIRKSITTKQSIQWFSSLSLFFLTLVSIGFSFVNVSDKGLRTAFLVFSIFAGVLLLYCFRRITNEYYNWSIQRKLNAREEVAKKKRELLEKVKETETFKVAKEILEKYDDSPPISGLTQQVRIPRPSLSSSQTIGSPDSSFTIAPTSKDKVADNTEQISGNKVKSEVNRTVEAALSPEIQSVHILSPKPPRPFFKPSRSVAEKVVDFIIGDTPSDRFALICSHCYGHNGMARKEEFDFLSYRCWICGEFNPARRQKKKTQLVHTQSGENLFIDTRMRALSEKDRGTEVKERKNRIKSRSTSHQRSLTDSKINKEERLEDNVELQDSSSLS